MKFTGDLKITRDIDGNFDTPIENGQPAMTDGIDTAIYFAVYGDRHTWQNSIAKNENEKIITKFPEIIARAVVCDKTKNDGTQELIRVLQFLKRIKAVKSIKASGQIISVYGIQWTVELEKPDGGSSKYSILWENMESDLFAE